MNNRITQILQILSVVVPLALIAIFWNRIPDPVPIHFDVKGEPNGYAPKIWGIFLLPAAEVFTYLVLLAIPYIDPKRKSPEFNNALNTFSAVFAIFFTALFVAILMSMLGITNNYVPCIVLVMLMVIGNFFGKLRPNYFIGIRTPWTLENETVWVKTHRLAGYIWVIASFIMLFVLFIPDKKILSYIFFIYIVAIAVVPIAYSYLLYRKLKKEGAV